MIERILVSVLTSLATRFMEWALEYVSRKRKDAADDDRLDRFNEAVKELKNAETPSKAERENFRKAARDLIRGDGL